MRTTAGPHCFDTFRVVSSLRINYAYYLTRSVGSNNRVLHLQYLLRGRGELVAVFFDELEQVESLWGDLVTLVSREERWV